MCQVAFVARSIVGRRKPSNGRDQERGQHGDQIDKPDAGEERLLKACSEEKVRCISMRSLMLAARRNGFVVRGFSTTTLGVGHLNAIGHELVGRTIWSEIRRQDPPNTAQLAQR